MRKFCLVILLLIVVSVSRAQDTTKVTTLKEVVISATRAEQPAIDIPRSVSVIHAEEIRTSIYQSVGELLNTQSGLYVVGANQNPGTNQNIFMRGSNSNQVAVLVDGVRITDPSSPNAAIDLSELSLTNIDRIEVIRGSHSTIFGGAAVGGVVNIITKRAAPPKFHGDVAVQGGNFGENAWTISENLNISYGFGSGMYLTGSLFQQNTAGLNSTDQSEAFPSYTSDRDDFRKTDGALKLGFQNEKWDANLSFKKVHQYTEIDNGAFSDDDNNYLDFDRDLLQYFSEYKINPELRISLLGSLSSSERFYENDSSLVAPATWDKSFSTGTYFGRLQTHELQLNYSNAVVKAVFGAGLYREKMFFDNYFFYNDPSFPFESTTNYDSIDARTTTGYVFARAGYAVGNFDLSGGARFSRHTTAGSFVTFEVNPSYSFRDFLIFGSVSTGFNAPSLYQLFDPSRSFSAYTTRGNMDLKPERSLSLEAGIKKQFTSGSYVTLSGYRTVVSDAIEYVYLWNGGKEVSGLDFSDDRGDTYINVAEQQVEGVEAEGLIQLSRSFSFLGNVSLLRAQVRSSPADLDVERTGGHHVQLYNLGKFLDQNFEQNDVVRRPGFTAYGRLSYLATARLTIEGIYRYTGDRYDAGYDGTLGPYGALARINVEAYHLVDANINWRVSEVLSAAFKVENIFDEAYREVVGFQTRGRSVFLKLTARF